MLWNVVFETGYSMI